MPVTGNWRSSAAGQGLALVGCRCTSRRRPSRVAPPSRRAPAQLPMVADTFLLQREAKGGPRWLTSTAYAAGRHRRHVAGAACVGAAAEPPRPAAARPLRWEAHGHRQRSRLTVDERREQLVRLGVDIFSERPYDEVSIDGIAAAAGISKGLLYHYFPSKRDFYVAVVATAPRSSSRDRHRRPGVSGGPRRRPGPLPGLRRGARQRLRGRARRGHRQNDPAVRAIVEDVRRAMTDRILDNLARRVEPPVPRRPPCSRCAAGSASPRPASTGSSAARCPRAAPRPSGLDARGRGHGRRRRRRPG